MCKFCYKDERHYVDIFVSTWTVKKENVLLKQNAAKEVGYKYEIWVYNEKGIIIDKII